MIWTTASFWPLPRALPSPPAKPRQFAQVENSGQVLSPCFAPSEIVTRKGSGMTRPIKLSSGSPRLDATQALGSGLFLDVKTLCHLAERALPLLAGQLCVAWCEMG